MDNIDYEIAELEAHGCIRWSGRSTIWKSPSGALFLGPHGAYQRMMKYQQLNVCKPKREVSIKPEVDEPLA